MTPDMQSASSESEASSPGPIRNDDLLIELPQIREGSVRLRTGIV